MPKRKSDVTNGEADEAPSLKKSDSDVQRMNETKSDFSKTDFSSDATTKDGRKWNFKISSWNVNGIRAWIQKDGTDYVEQERPDILCLQETKCNEKSIPEKAQLEGYHKYWSSAEKDGYSGTALLSKVKPENVTFGIGKKEHDAEGRCITAEYENFYVVTTYVPNAGRKLVRLDYRQKWDVDLREYLGNLDKKKPVILCGDLNVSHKEIDLKNPKPNMKNAGFTKEEREGLTNLLEAGFVDSFRELYPDQEDAWTFWTYMGNCREKDIGWRLDYFVISEGLKKNVCDSIMRKYILGSDHCPITLLLAQ